MSDARQIPDAQQLPDPFPIDPDDLPTLLDCPDLESSPLASIEIFEDLTQGATLRTRNKPETQEQRPVVTARGNRSLRYKSAVELATCVHGVLDDKATPPVPATLIILNYRLNGLARGKSNYAQVYTELEFANMVRGSPQTEPFVRAFVPFSVSGYDQETVREKLVKDTYKVTELGIKVQGVKANLGGDLGHELEETRRKRYFQLLQGSVSSVKDGMKGYDTVWWDLRQNDNTEEGVPSLFSTAMLVLRADMTTEFKAMFRLALRTGWLDGMTNRLTKFFGISRDDPIRFNPRLPPYGMPDWVDKNQLGKLLVDEEMNKLGGYQNLVNLGSNEE
jgi:hypothetical protein